MKPTYSIVLINLGLLILYSIIFLFIAPEGPYRAIGVMIGIAITMVAF